MRAVSVIIKNKQILLIHRFRNGKEYYVLPGGAVEKNENIKTAIIREIKEETNLDAKLDRKLWEYKNNFDNRIHHYFLVTKFKGDLKLSGPEAKRNSDFNKYILEWHNLFELDDLFIYPEKIKKKIIKEFTTTIN
jgi:8-oxo-dGTP pyrophosphatase MutT (NUDIX family)